MNWYGSWWFELPTRWATAVTTVSETTRDEVLRLTSCPPSKITVVPNPLPPGFDPDFKPFSGGHPQLLQVGTVDCKNVENVIRALSGLPCRLSIVGQLSSSQKDLLAQYGIDYRNVFGLSDSQIVEEYRRCDIVLFCSIHEGFGMPVIEANAVGRPIVASNIEPIKSIARSAACLVDPYDPSSIRCGIERVALDRAYRDRLVTEGFANARRFDPADVAGQYLAVYRRVIAANV